MGGIRSSLANAFSRLGRLGLCLGLGWLALAQALAAESARRLAIDQRRSSIGIEARAWGFIPASFAFVDFEADAAVAADGERLVEARFRLPVQALTSGDPRKDRRVRAWLEGERHPMIAFDLERSEPGADGERRAVGVLRLAGKTNEAVFNYQVSTEGSGQTRIEGEAVIDYREWGLPIFRVFIFSVNPKLRIRFELVGHLQGGGGGS